MLERGSRAFASALSKPRDSADIAITGATTTVNPNTVKIVRHFRTERAHSASTPGRTFAAD
jgi:hypothetical protein